jgi:hypothetical protein
MYSYVPADEPSQTAQWLADCCLRTTTYFDDNGVLLFQCIEYGDSR